MAFTEQGIAQLSGVLNSPRAIAVNIQIIRLFTKMLPAPADLRYAVLFQTTLLSPLRCGRSAIGQRYLRSVSRNYTNC
jgi:hypothetical protein